MTTVSLSSPIDNDERDYRAFLQRIQERLNATPGPLFTTDVPDDLYAQFLDALPATERQHNDCSACRRFVNTFGGLVTITPEGTTHSVFWHADDAPLPYRSSVEAILVAIKQARVTGVFLSSLPVWGAPITGAWHHLAATPPPALLFHRMTQTAGQVIAEKREDYGTLLRALADFTPEMLTTALGLLQSEALYRSERTLGVAQWLLVLQRQRTAAKGPRRDNLTWRAVATAPAGYCHPRSSMIGTLLEDIAAGLPFAEISTRFAAKMHPLHYQRPQSAPTAGNIKQAEQIIAQLQAAHALARRYARLEDIHALWTHMSQATPVPPATGVFGHLFPKQRATPPQLVTAPPVIMTWEKFQRTVLPTAQTIEYYVPNGRESYMAMVTAVDPAAPLLFQWDNPVSVYVYHGGSAPGDWGLTAGQFTPVVAVTLRPSMWGERAVTHQGAGVIFILEGAHDTQYQRAGLCVFPENLKAEFHSIRKTIEAYSRSGTIADADRASACGISLNKGGSWSARFRVVATHGTTTEYQLDRWD